MDKKGFVDFLEKKLCYLVDNVRKEEINKYESVIDNYVNMGQSEENAINSFGDPNDLVKAIYLSHGLDYKKLFTSNISGKGIKQAFKGFYSDISGGNKTKMKSAILYFLYIILLIVLLKIVFIFVRDLGGQFFTDLFENKTFYKIYDISFEILYILVATLVFFKLFTKKFNQ